jgi:hypothetical protein
MVLNFTTIYENLPNKVKGFLLYDGADDWYTIVLNCRMCYEGNKLTFEHEMQHIINHDVHCYKNVGLLEASMR